VDASGNGSLTVELLKSTGRRPPEETSIGVSIRYASAIFERSHIQNDYKVVLSFPNAPEQVRAGLILPTENNTNQVILAGKGEDIPPIDGNEFLSYARQLPTLTIYNAIENAKRLTEITPFSFPKADGDISHKSLTFLADCFRLGTQFVVLIQFTAKG
jgi:hypothetical protein